MMLGWDFKMNMGSSDILDNFIKGYQAAAMPRQIKDQRQAQALQQQIFQEQLRQAQLQNQFLPQQEQAKMALLKAQTERQNQPQQYSPTEVEKLNNYLKTLDPTSPEAQSVMARLKKITTSNNGITVNDPNTGMPIVSIGGNGAIGAGKTTAGQEPWYEKNPKTGTMEQIGWAVAPNEQEKREYAGRGFFNEVIPFVSQSTSLYSGKGGNQKFIEDINKFNTDENSHKNIVNFLAAMKLAPSAAVKENAALGGPNTQRVLSQIMGSINSSDVPDILKGIGSQYILPGSANQEASQIFQNIINQGTEKGQNSIPARIRRKFETEGNSSSSKERTFRNPKTGETLTESQLRQRGIWNG